MSNQITTAFVQQYSNNVQMLSQQKGSLLRSAVMLKLLLAKTHFSTKSEVLLQLKELQDMLTLHRWIHHMQEEELVLLIMSMQT